MITKLEIYGAILAIVLLGDLGFYFLGRYQEDKANRADQALADQKATREILDRAITLRGLDDKGADATDLLIAGINQRLTDVNSKFAKLPNVVVDARGCPQLGDNFGLRWNAAADLSAGSAVVPTTSNAPDAVLADPLPATR